MPCPLTPPAVSGDLAIDGAPTIAFQNTALCELLRGFADGSLATLHYLSNLANVPAFYCGTSPNKFFDYMLPVFRC